MEWFVRHYSIGENKYVVELATVRSLPVGALDMRSDSSTQIEKLLNRELPAGKLRCRRTKVAI